MNAISSRDRRHTDAIWTTLGGSIKPLRRTGEVLYTHPRFQRPVKASTNRKDTVAILVSRINQLLMGRVPQAA